MKRLYSLAKQWRFDVLALLILGSVVFLLVQPMRANEGMWRIFDDVHIARSEAVLGELRAGQFPVRMIQTFGNGGGYPLFNYYSPLTYYLTAFLIAIGTHPLNSVKLVFQAAYVLFALGMFFYLRGGLQLSRKAALVGAITAISSAYFNYDSYTRGALAELLGFAMLPWVLGFFELLLKHKKWYFVFGSAGMLSILFLFHAITGIIAVLMLTVVIGVRTLISSERRTENIWLTFVTFALCGLVSAWYLIPVVLEKKYVRYSIVEFVQTGYKDAALSLREVLGFTSINPEIKPVTLGLGISILVAMSAVVLLKKYQKLKRPSAHFFNENKVALSYGAGILTTLFLLSQSSWFLWERSSVLQALQFPYRFLSFLTCASIAFILITRKRSLSKWYRALVLVALIAASYQTKYFAQPSGYYFSDRFAAEDSCTTTTWQQEYLPIETSECIIKDSIPLVTASGGVEVLSKQDFASGDILVETGGSEGELRFAKYYLPGWHVYIDEKLSTPYPTTEHGLLTVMVPEGSHTVRAVYGKTLVQSVSEVISLVTLLALAGYTVIQIAVVLKEK